MAIPALLGIALQFAPTLAQWIGGDKAGRVAGQVADVAKNLIGTDDPDTLSKAIAADPNLALQFKLRLADIEDAERQRDHQAFIAGLQDTQNARQQTVDLAKAGSAIAWGPVVVSVIITLGYFIILYVLFNRDGLKVSDNLKDVMLFLLGALQIGFGQVCNYWLGSSAGSAKKDEAIKKMIA